MIITIIPGPPETKRIGPDRNKVILDGFMFRTINFGLFKLIKCYWLLSERADGKIIGHHKVLYEVELRPFWRKFK